MRSRFARFISNCWMAGTSAVPVSSPFCSLTREVSSDLMEVCSITFIRLVLQCAGLRYLYRGRRDSRLPFQCRTVRAFSVTLLLCPYQVSSADVVYATDHLQRAERPR